MFEYRARVLDVYDGDTCTVLVDLGFRCSVEVKVRLLGINAPELRGDTKDAGVAARDYLAGLILGRDVFLKTEKDKQEKYGRWLGVIYLRLDDNKSVNQKMIDDGYGVAYMV